MHPTADEVVNAQLVAQLPSEPNWEPNWCQA